MSNVQYSVYVISKGRPQKQIARRQFNSIGLEHFIVVEKEEYESYQRELPGNFLILPESNKGVSYARNFCLKHAIKRGDDVCIISDDDLKLMYAPKKIINGAVRRARIPIGKEHMDCFVSWFEQTPLTMATVPFEPKSFAIPLDITLHALQCTFVMYRIADVVDGNLFFDEKFLIYEDFTITLEALSQGRYVASLNSFCFRAPKPSTSPGGLEKTYKVPYIREDMNVKAHLKYPEGTLIRYSKDGTLKCVVDRKYYKKKFNFMPNHAFNREYPFVMRER